MGSFLWYGTKLGRQRFTMQHCEPGHSAGQRHVQPPQPIGLTSGDPAGLAFGVLGAESAEGVFGSETTEGARGSESADDGFRLTIVPVTLAKGLEFDHVVLAEPGRIAAGEAYGLRRLYVALTRAVSRLTVLHGEPLPAELRSVP